MKTRPDCDSARPMDMEMFVRMFISGRQKADVMMMGLVGYLDKSVMHTWNYMLYKYTCLLKR